MNRDAYSMLGTLARGYEVKIRLNRRWFVLVQDGQAIVATTNGEQHRFVGCKETEIKNELERYQPGSWRKSAWE